MVAELVAAGRARCWRCGRMIGPGEAWDLGHDDDDRSRYAGPEHQVCNRSAAGRRGRAVQLSGRDTVPAGAPFRLTMNGEPERTSRWW
jgi:hypothetical protein